MTIHKPLPIHPVTPQSVTRLLAYCHNYTPTRQCGTRLLAPKQQRQLALWLGQPRPTLRSVKHHLPLASHLVLAVGAGLLSYANKKIVVSNSATQWLKEAWERQLACLLDVLAQDAHWQAACQEISLSGAIPEDYRVYLRQSLQRQYRQPMPKPTTAKWVDREDESDLWLIDLPEDLPPRLLFDALQLGTWQPATPLCCTSLTIGQAFLRGFSQRHIQWLLEAITGMPLTPEQAGQLQRWQRQATAYQVQTVHLLTTAQDEQLAQILRQKKFRGSVCRQISRRHAVVSSEIFQPLSRWLGKKGIPLRLPHVARLEMSRNATLRFGHSQDNDADRGERGLFYSSSETGHGQTAWLGVRLLAALGELIPLSYPLPQAALAQLSEQIPSEQIAEMEFLAEKIMDSLRQAISGRDAFFPAHASVAPQIVETVQQAIDQEQPLSVAYQSLGERKPSWRRIQPLRLEKRGALTYLYAYCYRVEANLTFRLDRIERVGNGE